MIESEDHSGRTPLSYAAKYGHEDVVRLLLEKGATPDFKDALMPTWKRPKRSSSTSCDICQLDILKGDVYSHCGICSGGDFDICSICSEIDGDQSYGCESHRGSLSGAASRPIWPKKN